MDSGSMGSDGRAVWLVRHGNRIDFVDPSWRGRCGNDPHLSEDGIVQAKRTGLRLAGEGIEAVLSSPFLRGVQTADFIAEALGLKVFIEHGACEWMKAEWFPEGPPYKSPAEIAARFPRVDLRYESVLHPRYPETEEDAMSRAGEAARLLVEKFRGNIVVIGHGASVHGMAEGLLGGPRDIQCGLCSLVKVLRRGDRWDLELNGDASHLGGGETHAGRFV